jgi:uncharacterized membrane protein (DUF441 family)
MLNDLLLASAILVPIVTALVGVVKMVGLPSRFAPLSAIIIGVAVEFLAVGVVVNSPSVATTVLLGLGVGLSSAGLYSGGKTTFSAN